MIQIKIKLSKTNKSDQHIINYFKCNSDYVYCGHTETQKNITVSLDNKHNKKLSNIVHDVEAFNTWANIPNEKTLLITNSNTIKV